LNDNPAYAAVVQAAVAGYADRVLDAAQLRAGMTLADVGAGEGVIAFRSIDRIGPSLRCVLTDVSRPMPRYAEAAAARIFPRPQAGGKDFDCEPILQDEAFYARASDHELFGANAAEFRPRSGVQ
jgi:hypothetical protein